MKTYRNLIGTGCSFTDYTGRPPATFNQIVADRLGIDYLDLSAGAGSNERWWRILLSGIREGKVSKDDLLVLQYTNIHRKELVTNLVETPPVAPDPWTPDRKKPKPNNNTKQIREKYTDLFSTIKWMHNSFISNDNKKLNSYYKMLQDHCWCPEYQVEKWRNQHLALQYILADYNVIYLYTGYLGDIKWEEFLSSTNNQATIIRFTQNCIQNNEWCLLPPHDCAHINYKGHQAVAETIYSALEYSKFDKNTPPDVLEIK